MLIDEKGRVADGDQLMALIASQWAREGKLIGSTLVATIMSNMGLETFLKGQNIDLLRTGVGDRYVVEEMRKNGFNLGGEQSGHIVMTEYVTTGDGLIAALQFLRTLVDSGKPASELLRVFEPMPQLLQNVRFTAGTTPLENTNVKAAIKDGEAQFGNRGRLVIRKSGTEPLVRVMGECEDEALLKSVVGTISDEVAKV
jgi:phosphoglucosamine mutase